MILVANATNPKNIGDLAILLGSLSLINKKNKIKIHSTESQFYKKIINKDFGDTLYSWAIFDNLNSYIRLNRILELILAYTSIKFLKTPIIFDKKLKKLSKDYLEADLIIFAGGGYLRSQKGLTQSLNLIMTLFMFQFAKLSKAKKIVSPISFGPFAYKWQEKYSASVLKDLDLVSTREDISYNKLKKYKFKNLIRSVDAAIFLKFDNVKKNDQPTVGFTIRKWLDKGSQEIFENNFIEALVSFSKTTKIIYQPIVQVDAPEYGDDDLQRTNKISEILKEKGLAVNPTVKIEDLNKSVKIYGKIHLLIGMRMHSNILAALYGTPFIAIAYEHKTTGISADLGMEDYVLDIGDVTNEKLNEILDKAYKNRIYLTNTINKSINSLRTRESIRWAEIIQKYQSL